MIPDNTVLPEPEAIALLQQYHLPYPKNGFVHTADEAVTLAERIGYPVVLKIVAEGVSHKSDIGGVKVNLTTSESVIDAYHQITGTLAQNVPDACLSGVLVCKQADPGIEMIVGGIQDVMFGPCLMVGLGGIFIEVLKDVAFRVIPLKKIDALEMLKELRGYPVLLGVRGGETVDIDSLAEFLLKVSDFFQANQWIKELDMNPVRVNGKKITILDIRVVR